MEIESRLVVSQGWEWAGEKQRVTANGYRLFWVQ